MSPERIAELRSRSRKTVKSEATGDEYTIRRLTAFDLLTAGLSPILALKKKGMADADLGESPEAQTAVAEAMPKIIAGGCMSPCVYTGPEMDTPDGAVHLNWIAADAGFLFAEIVAFSGVNDEGHARMEAVSKNGNGSEFSTESEDGMAASLRN